jgi:hypothetical protein
MENPEKLTPEVPAEDKSGEVNAMELERRVIRPKPKPRRATARKKTNSKSIRGAPMTPPKKARKRNHKRGHK